jgi:hypothetical protein
MMLEYRSGRIVRPQFRWGQAVLDPTLRRIWAIPVATGCGGASATKQRGEERAQRGEWCPRNESERGFQRFQVSANRADGPQGRDEINLLHSKGPWVYKVPIRSSKRKSQIRPAGV